MLKLKIPVMASNENLALSNIGMVSASGYEEDGLQRAQSRHSQVHGQEFENASLPKADGGKDAWLFLAGCFCIEALTWGKCIHFYFASTLEETVMSMTHTPVGLLSRLLSHLLFLSTILSMPEMLAIVILIILNGF